MRTNKLERLSGKPDLIFAGTAGTYPKGNTIRGLQPYQQILDQAGKACQGQTLQLIWPCRQLWQKKFYNIDSRGLYYKTFYARNLHILVISKSVYPWQAFPALSDVCGEARSLPQSVAHERCFTRVGSALTCKHQTRLERLARDKHFSLLRESVNYDRKKFYSTGPRCKCCKTFFIITDGRAK